MTGSKFFSSNIGKIKLLKIKELKNLSTNEKLHETIKENLSAGEDLYCEFNDESIAIEIPFRSCGIGTQVLFQFEILSIDEVVELFGTGKIIDVDLKNPDNHILVRAEIKLAQYDRDIWESILADQRKRQKQLAKVFESIKG